MYVNFTQLLQKCLISYTQDLSTQSLTKVHLRIKSKNRELRRQWQYTRKTIITNRFNQQTAIVTFGLEKQRGRMVMHLHQNQNLHKN